MFSFGQWVTPLAPWISCLFFIPCLHKACAGPRSWRGGPERIEIGEFDELSSALGSEGWLEDGEGSLLRSCFLEILNGWP
jgi:hypothetical protein